MGPRRMIEVPIPSRFNVSIMISDGGAIVLKEVDRRQLENGLVKIVPILEELDRDLNKLPRPQQNLENAIRGVDEYRSRNHCADHDFFRFSCSNCIAVAARRNTEEVPHCRNHLEFRSDCESCRLTRKYP